MGCFVLLLFVLGLVCIVAACAALGTRIAYLCIPGIFLGVILCMISIVLVFMMPLLM